jgi:hypothetical protein
MTRNASAVWDYIPFTNKSSTPAATPGNSYSGGVATSSYSSSNIAYNAYGANGHGGIGYGYAGGVGGSREDLYAYGSAAGMSGGMDRPLPPRSGPGGYGHRPKSIDLVTPFGGHH